MMQQFCSNCGSRLIVGNAFCTNCGASVNQNVNPMPQGNPMQPGPGMPQGNPMQPGTGMPQGNPMQPGPGMPQGNPMQPGTGMPQGNPMYQARGMVNRAAGMAYNTPMGNAAAGAVNNFLPRDAAGQFLKIEGPVSTVLSGVGMFFKGIGGMFKNPKALLAALLSALVWVAALVLPRIGADILPVRALSALTFATGGLEGGVIHRFFGYFGKGMIAACVTSLFTGGGRRIRTGFKNIGKGLGDVKGIIPFIFGIITSCIIYFLIQGQSGFDAIPAAFAGALLAVQAAGATSGWIRNIARSWTSKKKRNIRWPNDNKANALIGGFSMGWMIAALVGTLMTVVAPAAIVVYADEANSASARDDYKLTAKDISGEWDITLTMGNIDSPLARKIEETFGEGVVTYYYDENTTITTDVKVYIAETAPHIMEAELYANDGTHYVYRGYYKDETVKLWITKVLGAPEDDDGSISEAINYLEFDFDLDGDTVICDGTYYKGLSYIVNYNVTYHGTRVGAFNGELEPLSNRDIVVQSVARTIAGEDDGTLVPATIVGVAGAMAAAGAAGAAGASTTAEGEKEEEEQKQFKLKVYKEFGDTIRRGEKLVVYAHMVSVGKNGETEEPGLTANIRIFSQDGVFDVDCQNELAGDYKGAWVTVSENAPANAELGVISFQFMGVGGSVTNQMTFKVGKAEIILYQNNIALPALDEEGAAVGFTVSGIDPEKCNVEVSMNEGSSYAVDYIESENAPGTYFAVLADINTDPGESGTYAENTLTFRAWDDNIEVENFMDVYRVTTGLNVAAEALNCFRMLKKEAVGKEVQDLVASDFQISKTEIAAMYLEYDKEGQSMFYRPVEPVITFEPLDEQKSDKTIQERLDGIGLEAMLKGSQDSVSLYDVACTKGWLEPPLRFRVMMYAYVDEEDENGQPVRYECKKEVLLQSQPLREHAIKTDDDIKIENWITDFRSMIYDLNIAIPALNIDALGGELAMLDLLQDGYDEHYGYDPILIAQIQYGVKKYIHDIQMTALKHRQEIFEDWSATHHADANSTAMIWAHSFKMINDNYLDNWKGLVARIGLGIASGGWSEAVFLPMDVNKAVVNYYDATPLSARNGTDAMIAGSIPVMVTLAVQGTTMLVGAVIPPEVTENCKQWVMAKTGALMTKRVQNVVFAAKGLKDKFARKLASLKTLSYDPKTKCLYITEAASKVDNVVAVGRSKALTSISKSKAIPRTEEGKLISVLSDAGNRRGAESVSRFKKAIKSGNTSEIEAAYWDVRTNTFAKNRMNIAGKTREQILAGENVANAERALYNQLDDQLLQEPAAKFMTQEAVATGKCSADKVVLFNGTGHTTADATKGFKVSMDTDMKPMYKLPSGHAADFSKDETVRIVGRGYAKAAGKPCSTDAEILLSMKELNVEAIYSGHAEQYRELGKVLKGEAVSAQSSVANMGVRAEKLISGVKRGQTEIKNIVSDSAKKLRIETEAAKYAEGKLSYSALTQETKDAIKVVQDMQNSFHQANKTLKLDLGKEFKAQALGNKPTFTTENIEFAQKCDFTEQLGNYDMGMMMDELASKGTSYETEAMNLIINGDKVNSLCKGLNPSVVDGGAVKTIVDGVSQGTKIATSKTISDNVQ